MIMKLEKLKKEILEECLELIKEGHEAVVNKEEVAEYNQKVENFIFQTITKAHQQGKKDEV